MPLTLFLATTNPGKLRDFASATTPGIHLEPLPGLATLPTPEETEPTFQGNADLKATAYSRLAPDHLVLADDSGLEVDALHGAPGVRSARFAADREQAREQTRTQTQTPSQTQAQPNTQATSRPNPPSSRTISTSTDQRNNSALLDALASTRQSERTARYHCALALARNGQVLARGTGSVEGEILAVPRGLAGFGYDSLFLLPDLGLTMAELSPPDRLAHSHRARALTALLASLTPNHL